MSSKLTLNGKEYDLTGHIPFKIRVWRRLKANLGLTPANMVERTNEDVALMAEVMFELFKDIDPTIPSAAFENLTPKEITEAFQGGDVDRPTSIGSTTSPVNTGGQPAT